MSLIFYKILSALGIMVLTIISGLVPLRLALKHKRLFAYSDAFASGIFLSASLLHLLPDATNGFSASYPNFHYPFAQLICVITFMILLLLERSVILYGAYHKPNGHNLAPLLLALVISVHSVVEGAAIGINSSLAGMSVILLAVLAHKSSEGIALSCNLHRYNIEFKSIVKIILLFSLTSPLGIFLAGTSGHFIAANTEKLSEIVLDAVAAGTFLYLGTVHIIEKDKKFEDVAEIISIVLGITLMGLVAIYT